jgi:riboflavin kinase/FMN adenylyltransferase
MQIIRGLKNLNNLNGCVATIGNFDGVHLAHQKILNDLTIAAKKLNLPSVVISFTPNPAKFFGKNIKIITSFKDKYQLLKNNNIDILLLINFNFNFANINPQDFINNILIDKLNIQKLFIGDDFRFGKNRAGDFQMLNKNLSVIKIDEFLKNKVRVSSSNIRKLLSAGDFENAKNMLGRDFQICGKVISGKKLGRTIGFPTANISIKNQNLCVRGVFAVEIIIDKISYKSIANVGVKPSIDNKNKLTLEVHIFDFNEDIYSKNAIITFKEKIRNEKKFTSLDELKKQIIKDCKQVKNTV